MSGSNKKDDKDKKTPPPKKKDAAASTSKSENPESVITGSIALPIANPNKMRPESMQFRVKGSSVTAASPPKYISLEEIMKAAHGVQDMALAHEIAIDDDFRLEPFDPPDNSYQKLVKDTMHRAFFDILREELNSNPPIYKQAYVLLEDVKEGLFSILMPRHTKIREMINEVLDQSFIKQQAENGAIEFKKYADFVIDLMAKLAAPCRDEMIQDITKLTDTVDIFRAILETLEVLKLDLANTLITMIRPHVQAQSVQYEQAKFKEFLEIQEDGLANTRSWLIPHIDKSVAKPKESDPAFLKNTTSQTLAKAFLELLEWKANKPYPETVQMDATRYADLAQALFKLESCACILLVSPSCGAANESSTNEFKVELKDKITILMKDVTNETELEKALPFIAEQVIADTEKLIAKFKQKPLTKDIKDTIKSQIEGMKDSDHKVKKLVRLRIMEFLKDILICGGGSKQVPVGLSAFSKELTSLAGTLLRLVMHNKAVFSQYYTGIVAAELDK